MFEPRFGYAELRGGRFRPVLVRMLVGVVITLLVVCARVLDGPHPRVARKTKGQSKPPPELDSLADFVNFGVAPGLILYFWQLHALHNGGWTCATGLGARRGPRASPWQ